MKTFKQVLEDKKIPKGYHRMPDGTLMKDSDHEGEIDELSIAQDIQRRRNRKLASLQKSMAKYRAASKAGIHPSRVNQRRTSLTLKKR